jgi:hypothetical protein
VVATRRTRRVRVHRHNRAPSVAKSISASFEIQFGSIRYAQGDATNGQLAFPKLLGEEITRAQRF